MHGSTFDRREYVASCFAVISLHCGADGPLIASESLWIPRCRAPITVATRHGRSVLFSRP
jgi:hypothetical protein